MIGHISSWDVREEDFVPSEQPIDAILAEAWGKVGDGGEGKLIPLFLVMKTSLMRTPKDAASLLWGHRFRAIGVLWGCHKVKVICSAVWREGGRVSGGIGPLPLPWLVAGMVMVGEGRRRW